MTTETTWLVDTSALAWMANSPDAGTWVARISRGLVRIASVSLLEIGYSARSGTDLRSDVTRPPLSDLSVQYLTPAMEDRAVEVQLLLADRGQHRAPSVSDLLVAAAAELGGLTVLHVDKDFDLIAEVTGQTTERLTLDT